MAALVDNNGVTTVDEKKWREIEEFLTEHGIKLHRRKMRDLICFTEDRLAVYKGNITISSSCRVSLES